MGGICYQANSNCSLLFPSLRTTSVMSKQAFTVRQGERELGMLMANGDYSGEFISCLLRQEFFNVAVQPGQKVSERQR